MARFDKYNGVSGGFRGKLKVAMTVYVAGNPATTALNKERLFGVSIEAATGLLIVGGALAAIRGVINVREDKAAGEMVDVMTNGEIADYFFENNGSTPVTLGTPYYADNVAGGVTAVSTSNKQIGFTVADSVSGRGRLVVRVVQ